MSDKEKTLRHPLLRLGTTVAVVALLLVVLLVALLWPPTPETVVSELLVALHRNDSARALDLTTGPAFTQLQNAIDGEPAGDWHQLWHEADSLLLDFRVIEAEIDGDEARVLVYFGQGLFRSQVFVLQRVDRSWRVYQLGN